MGRQSGAVMDHQWDRHWLVRSEEVSTRDNPLGHAQRASNAQQGGPTQDGVPCDVTDGASGRCSQIAWQVHE